MKQKALPNRHSLGRTLQLNILLAGSKANFEIINPHFHKKSHWIKKTRKKSGFKVSKLVVGSSVQERK